MQCLGQWGPHTHTSVCSHSNTEPAYQSELKQTSAIPLHLQRCPVEIIRKCKLSVSVYFHRTIWCWWTAYLLTESSSSQETVNSLVRVWGRKDKEKQRTGKCFFCCATQMISESEEKFYSFLSVRATSRVSHHLYHQPWEGKATGNLLPFGIELCGDTEALALHFHLNVDSSSSSKARAKDI